MLRDLSFRLAPGETLGIAGPTGAGKSTLIKLLLRFYDVTAGAVRLDGHDVREISLADLRHNIALVSQDVYLFHGTIRENIAYCDATPGSTRWCGPRSSPSSTISWPRCRDGYETLVGERGVKLSGGQRQRLSIARAIVKDAPVLILDEATSSVDTETERAIQENLQDPDRRPHGARSSPTACRPSATPTASSSCATAASPRRGPTTA